MASDCRGFGRPQIERTVNAWWYGTSGAQPHPHCQTRARPPPAPHGKHFADVEFLEENLADAGCVILKKVARDKDLAESAHGGLGVEQQNAKCGRWLNSSGGAVALGPSSLGRVWTCLAVATSRVAQRLVPSHHYQYAVRPDWPPLASPVGLRGGLRKTFPVYPTSQVANSKCSGGNAFTSVKQHICL
ncbi:hypothetical protein B0H10DRAFT_1955823 [Mycena sp. CBHHK59/15]|nr:hypothetical protein B0H10DRAFT_1955823 [Mycena sp. CBHHK59/15]